MPFVNNNNVKIHWQEKGEGTPLLLIMGHRFSGEMWWPVLPAVTAKHRVVWFDNRGTGQTDTSKTASVDEMVSDVIAVMDAAGIEKAHVFGVSMGGGIAQQVAVRHPERVTSLILGCTVCKTEVSDPPKPIAKLLVRLPVWFYKALGGSSLWAPGANPEAVKKDYEMLKKDKFTAQGVIAQSVGIAEFSMSLDDIAAFTIPVLVQHGTADKAVPYAAGQQLAATIPGARLSTFEGAAHNYLVHDPDRANREVLEFLAEVDGAGTAPVDTASATV